MPWHPVHQISAHFALTAEIETAETGDRIFKQDGLARARRKAVARLL